MKAAPLILSALCVALAAPGGNVLCAQQKTAHKRAKASAQPAAEAAAAKADEQKLSTQDLLHPYAGQADNASAFGFDPEPKARPFGKPGDDSPVSLRFERETVIDPLTRKDLSPRADPQKLRENIKNLKLKDAMDQTGGKADVQVDILKF